MGTIETNDAASEARSINALSAEVKTTVTLTKEFYSCVVRDLRSKSGAFHRAVSPPPEAPTEEEEALILAKGIPEEGQKTNA